MQVPDTVQLNSQRHLQEPFGMIAASVGDPGSGEFLILDPGWKGPEPETEPARTNKYVS